jgi:SAM-dependent methyltransferase
MVNGCWLRFATAISHMPARKQPCGWRGNVCQNVQINLASTPDAGEVELRLSFNPRAGARWSGWTLMRRQFLFAQSAYTEVRFVAADVTCAGELFPTQFDIIFAFNAFYAFPEQQAALGALRLAGKPDAILCLFDYLDRGGFTETPFAENLRRCSGVRYR